MNVSAANSPLQGDWLPIFPTSHFIFFFFIWMPGLTSLDISDCSSKAVLSFWLYVLRPQQSKQQFYLSINPSELTTGMFSGHLFWSVCLSLPSDFTVSFSCYSFMADSSPPKTHHHASLSEEKMGWGKHKYTKRLHKAETLELGQVSFNGMMRYLFSAPNSTTVFMAKVSNHEKRQNCALFKWKLMGFNEFWDTEVWHSIKEKKK